jgi:hypothetical protein
MMKKGRKKKNHGRTENVYTRRHFEKESMPREAAAQQKGQSMASGENPLRVGRFGISDERPRLFFSFLLPNTFWLARRFPTPIINPERLYTQLKRRRQVLCSTIRWGKKKGTTFYCGPSKGFIRNTAQKRRPNNLI